MDKPATLCDKCEIAAICLLDYDGVACRKSRTVEPTNGDRIRAMTDEELAKLISDDDGCCIPAGKCPEEFVSKGFLKCRACWLKWLQQEAEND